jgi:hypothetical protein
MGIHANQIGRGIATSIQEDFRAQAVAPSDGGQFRRA